MPDLWYCVGCCVHELREVHHTLPLVLGHVDALDRGEAGVGIPEVLQLELPVGQPGPGQLHKHLPGQNGGEHGEGSHLKYHIYFLLRMLPCA